MLLLHQLSSWNAVLCSVLCGAMQCYRVHNKCSRALFNNSSRILCGNSMFRLTHPSQSYQMKLVKPFQSKISQKSENVKYCEIFSYEWAEKIEKHASKTEKKIQTTWHNYSEDLENSTISIKKKKHGLLLSLALKTAPSKGPQMQAASLHLISTNGRARRSMVFYGVLMCSLLVRFHANVLDVVNVVMSNPWMSMVDLGTLGSSKWWISKDFQLGYQGGMYLSNEEQHDSFFYPLHS